MTAKKPAETPAVEAPAETPAALSFEEVTEVPTTHRTRERKATRFDAAVQGLADDREKKGLKFEAPTKDLKSIRRELTSAGNAVKPNPVTVNMRSTPNGDKSVIVFSVRDKIVQERKPADAPASEDGKANSV